RPAVAVEPMGKAADQQRCAARPRLTREPGAVAAEQGEELDRIGAGPFARCPGLVPAHGAAQRETQQRTPAAQANDRRRPRQATPQPPRIAGGQVKLQASLGDPRVDLIELAIENWREQPKHAACALRLLLSLFP